MTTSLARALSMTHALCMKIPKTVRKKVVRDSIDTYLAVLHPSSVQTSFEILKGETKADHHLITVRIYLNSDYYFDIQLTIKDRDGVSYLQSEAPAFIVSQDRISVQLLRWRLKINNKIWRESGGGY